MPNTFNADGTPDNDTRTGYEYSGVSMNTRKAIKDLDEGKEGSQEPPVTIRPADQGVRPYTKSTPAQDAQFKALIAKRGGR